MEIENDQQEVFVKNWVDYSSKYGLGYILSNGSTGVLYNDRSKIILHPKNTYFEYLVKQNSEKENKKIDVAQWHTLEDYPQTTLKKKVMLLKHFKAYLEGENNKIQREKFDKKEIKDKKSLLNLVYVKKWMKTKHAIMFRLSNR